MEGRAKELPKFNFTHLYFSQEVFQLIYDVSKRRSHQRILVPTRSHQRISTSISAPIYSFNSNNLNTAKLQSIEQRHVN